MEGKIQNMKKLWDNVKRYNICIPGIPDREERENTIEEIFEVLMAKKFPKLMKEPGSSENIK